MTRHHGNAEKSRRKYTERTKRRVPKAELINFMLAMIETRRVIEESDGRRAKVSQRMAADLCRSLVRM
jgi:hypothetical protein